MADQKVVVLFPGQGAFDGAALADAARQHPQVAQTFQAIDAVCADLYGRGLSDIVLADPAPSIERLLEDAPWVSQLAIYGADVAAYRILADHGLRPDMLVGHSLGEIAALVAAGAFSVEDGARIVAARVEVILEHAQVDGRMVALGADDARAAKLIDLIGEPMLAIATENHDEQTVLSGPVAAIERVIAIAGHLDVGAVELKAPFPFHTPALASAVPLFADRIRRLEQHALELPVYSPILERYYEPGDDLAELLARHFVAPVRFAAGIRRMREEGATHFVEAGGKAALSTAVRKILADTDVATFPSLNTTREGLLALDTTLARLRGMGLAGGNPTEQLRAILAPGTDSEVFARFWAAHGGKVAEMTQALLADFTPAQSAPETARATAALRNIAISDVAIGDDAIGDTAFGDEAIGDTAIGDAPSNGTADGTIDRDSVAASIRNVYAKALEYPEEVFTDDVLLEAELGVDSVKQVELLTRVSNQYGLAARGGDFQLADYDTMRKIIDFVITQKV